MSDLHIGRRQTGSGRFILPHPRRQAVSPSQLWPRLRPGVQTTFTTTHDSRSALGLTRCHIRVCKRPGAAAFGGCKGSTREGRSKHQNGLDSISLAAKVAGLFSAVTSDTPGRPRRLARIGLQGSLPRDPRGPIHDRLLIAGLRPRHSGPSQSWSRQTTQIDHRWLHLLITLLLCTMNHSTGHPGGTLFTSLLHGPSEQYTDRRPM